MPYRSSLLIRLVMFVAHCYLFFAIPVSIHIATMVAPVLLSTTEYCVLRTACCVLRAKYYH